MPSGYSQTPLLRKLGIKEGQRLIILNAPDDYDLTLGGLPEGVDVAKRLDGILDFIQFFAVSKAELAAEFPRLKRFLAANGMLWVSWPKRSSKVETDLKESVVMETGLANGLVDVKVAAVDETWSGLKFVYRREDRP